jgi:phospholipase C
VKSVTLSASGSATTTAVTLSRPSNKLCGWSAPPSRYQHVIWIWFENHSYGKIVGSSSAPYMNNTLGTQCGLATNFHNISHPSLPNYLGATSGLTNGLDRDCAPSSCSSSSRSIFKQLEQAGLTWKGYAESMTHNCAIYDTSPYAVRHNPPPYYTDVKATCPTKDVPLGAAADGNFARDLANDTLPSFAFVAPNLCNDMHDCSVSTGDAWLKTWLTKVVNAPAYNAGNTAVFVTFDEGGGGTHGEDCASPSNNDETCHVATYVLGPAVPAGARVSTRFTHYSMLRSTESMLGLTTFLGNAATATGMRQSFHL